jgi:transcriptional regulator with XRE-family HTH domain
VERVITLTLEEAPEDATHWSTRAMSRRTGMSQSAISRIWRAFALQPHRHETFKLSKDPLFIEKVRDIVGLYLHPPERAMVLCVDEKSQIQALDRSAPLLPMRPGQVERRTHDYVRHGTTSSRYQDGGGAGFLQSTSPLGRVPQVPRPDRGQRSRLLRRPPRPRQLQHTQDAPHSALACQAPALPPPLHSHQRLVAQSGRKMVRCADREATPPRCPSQHTRTRASHLHVRRQNQPAPQPLHLDQVR